MYLNLVPDVVASAAHPLVELPAANLDHLAPHVTRLRGGFHLLRFPTQVLAQVCQGVVGLCLQRLAH